MRANSDRARIVTFNDAVCPLRTLMWSLMQRLMLSLVQSLFCRSLLSCNIEDVTGTAKCRVGSYDTEGSSVSYGLHLHVAVQ